MLVLGSSGVFPELFFAPEDVAGSLPGNLPERLFFRRGGAGDPETAKHVLEAHGDSWNDVFFFRPPPGAPQTFFFFRPPQAPDERLFVFS